MNPISMVKDEANLIKQAVLLCLVKHVLLNPNRSILISHPIYKYGTLDDYNDDES